MNNNKKIFSSNDKMEGFIYLYINIILQYQKRYMVLEDYALTIYSSKEAIIKSHDYSYHLKFLVISDHKPSEKLLYFNYFKKKVYLYIDSND